MFDVCNDMSFSADPFYQQGVYRDLILYTSGKNPLA